MVGVCFFFEQNDIDVWSGRKADLDAWNYAIKAAGDVDRVVVVNRTDLKLRTFDADLDLMFVDELPELLGRRIHVHAPREPAKQTTPLWAFDHLGVDWYLFGPAMGWRCEIPEGIHIPTANDVELHAVHIASIVMAHRFRYNR